MTMRKASCREIDVEVQHGGKTWLVSVSYTAINERFGDDADGNRGIWQRYIEIDDMDAVDEHDKHASVDELSAMHESALEKCYADDAD